MLLQLLISKKAKEQSLCETRKKREKETISRFFLIYFLRWIT